MSHCVAFDVVAKKDARLLILGSLPGEESLRKRQYYARKGNCFWKIMSSLLDVKEDASYSERLVSLQKKRIALWDVCASAVRVGSLDSEIQTATIAYNNFASFFQTHKKIELIGFNGRHAEKLFTRFVIPGLSTAVHVPESVILPSTSPAYASMPLAEKLACWRKVLRSYY